MSPFRPARPARLVDRRTIVALPAIVLIAAACSRSAPTVAAEPERTARRRPLADLYQCEGCDGVYERDAATFDWQTRVAPPGEPGEPFVYEGTVYATDGKTPAPGVILYAYQTNAEGLYANGTPETEWSRRHGRLRGWVRTDAQGRYRFVSIKPAPYPDRDLPAHVHLTVLEPGRRPYWIDDIVFAGECGVTPAYRASMIDKGGNGIVPLTRDGEGRWHATRDIVLEPHPS